MITGVMCMNKSIRLNRVLMRASRASGWILLFLIIVFMVTGYGITGKYGANRLIGAQLALSIHQNICYLMIPLFLIHSFVNIRFALKRWRALKHGSEKKKK